LAAFRIALAIWAIVAVVALFAQPVGMIGDAGEYALMLMPWVRHYTPEIRPDDIRAYNGLLETQPLPDAAPARPFPDPFIQAPNSNPPTWDLRHFWFYSLLARPFLPLTRLPGFHPFAAFVFLNLALMLAVVWLAHRWNGPQGALAAAIGSACSPAFWLTNKVHTELLTVAGLFACLIALSAGRPAWAGFFTAFAAAQNNLLAPLAVLLLAWSWITRRESARLRLVLSVASAVLMALAPAYYWARHGFTSPLTALGYVFPELAGWRRILSLWIDPDRGLLPLWPLALPCLVLGMAIIIRQRRPPGPAFWIVAAYLAFAQAVMSMQVNWNPGGSHLAHRYAVWFVPLAWFPLRRWIEFALAGRDWRRIGALSALILLGAWSASQYRPSQPDTVVQFNALSRWWYANLPSLYNPDPEIFLERACFAEAGGYSQPLRRIDRRLLRCLGGDAAEKGFWAASDPSCRKLYISREGLEEQRHRATPAPIAGCAQNVDLRSALDRALEAAPPGDRDFYLNLH